MTGTVEIPNLSEEHENINDVDVDVTTKDRGPEAEIIKELMRKGTGAKAVRDTLQVSMTNHIFTIHPEQWACRKLLGGQPPCQPLSPWT